ncbi:MAG: zinc ribbon domain-containing protein [Eubacteriales bacterium]|nr:zinc ribbon domain-containing protein [Eubacteriales bacterium]
MYCANCGSYNKDGSRFCTNCGAPLAADSSASSYGAGPAGSAPGFSGYSGSGYGQGEGEYRSPAGVRILRSVAGSPLFLVAAIAFTATIIAGYFARITLADIQYGISQASEYLQQLGISEEDLQELMDAINIETVTGPGSFLTYLASHGLSILTALGLFLTCAAAKRDDDSTFPASGLTVLQIVSVINFVIFILVSLAVLLGLGVGGFWFASSYNASGYNDERTTILAIVAVVLVVVFLVLLFPFLYFKKIVGMLGSAKTMAGGQKPKRNGSVYVAVILLISAVYSFCSAIGGNTSGFLAATAASRINSAVQAVSSLCFALLIFSFRKKCREEGY